MASSLSRNHYLAPLLRHPGAKHMLILQLKVILTSRPKLFLVYLASFDRINCPWLIFNIEALCLILLVFVEEVGKPELVPSRIEDKASVIGGIYNGEVVGEYLCMANVVFVEKHSLRLDALADPFQLQYFWIFYVQYSVNIVNL
jgi:hypothetical protein